MRKTLQTEHPTRYTTSFIIRTGALIMLLESVHFGTVPDFDSNERMALLSTLLQENLCEVTFTKLDGSTRVMQCTADPSRIPEAHRPSSTPKVVKNSDPDKPLTMSVYLPEEATWRSFRVNNVVSIEVFDS